MEDNKSSQAPLQFESDKNKPLEKEGKEEEKEEEKDEYRHGSPNPFESPFSGSDLVLVCEGKRLHVHKCILVMHSPVFKAMFSGGFKESAEQEIELGHVRHDAMVYFLKCLYPDNAMREIESDEVLRGVLPIADYYQCDHVKDRCEVYISKFIKSINIHSSGFISDPHRAMLYIYLCSMYDCISQYERQLMEIAAMSKSDCIQHNHFYSKLSESKKLELFTHRLSRIDDKHSPPTNRGSYSNRCYRDGCGTCFAITLDQKDYTLKKDSVNAELGII